jgi:hypothetical protein
MNVAPRTPKLTPAGLPAQYRLRRCRTDACGLPALAHPAASAQERVELPRPSAARRPGPLPALHARRPLYWAGSTALSLSFSSQPLHPPQGRASPTPHRVHRFDALADPVALLALGDVHVLRRRGARGSGRSVARGHMRQGGLHRPALPSQPHGGSGGAAEGGRRSGRAQLRRHRAPPRPGPTHPPHPYRTLPQPLTCLRGYGSTGLHLYCSALVLTITAHSRPYIHYICVHIRCHGNAPLMHSHLVADGPAVRLAQTREQLAQRARGAALGEETRLVPVAHEEPGRGGQAARHARPHARVMASVRRTSGRRGGPRGRREARHGRREARHGRCRVRRYELRRPARAAPRRRRAARCSAARSPPHRSAVPRLAAAVSLPLSRQPLLHRPAGPPSP